MSLNRIALPMTVLALVVAMPPAAHAVSLSTDRINTIQERCTLLQTSLDQIQRRDLVARTDHGREYENIIKQMDAFSQRLRHNNMPSQTLDTPANSFKVAVNAFREAYIRYDDSMNALSDIDCHVRTTDFVQQLEQSRVLRATVGAEAAKADVALQTYRQAMVTLQSTLPSVAAQGGAQ